MPSIDLSILNQRQTPAFYADTLANRPAAGFVGRIFVSTNTYAFYRDNGTSWDLIGGPGTGTVTGTGADGQVTFWNGASTISGSNNLFWDNVNGHLGIKTITPTSALDVNHSGTLIASFNNTSSVNSLVGFKNAGNEQWWIGTENTNDDFLFYDATNFPTLTLRTTFKTSGQVLIGGGSTGSGKLVVESATSDNGIQIVGANAPSLRIDNANTGATLRIGLGISTGTNNFIQGSASGNMCVFNGSTTASPMLFGIYDTTNVQEAARISAARNFIIGKTTDSGQKLQVQGTATFSNTVAAASFDVANGNYFRAQQNSGGTYQVALGYQAGTNDLILNFSDNLRVKSLLGADLLTIASSGNVGIGSSNPSYLLDLQTGYSTNKTLLRLGNNTASAANGDKLNIDFFSYNDNYINARISREITDYTTYAGALTFSTGQSSSITERLRITSAGNVGIGTGTPYTSLDVRSGVARAIGSTTTDFVTGSAGSLIWMGLAAATGNTYGRIQVSNGGDATGAALSLNAGSGNVLIGTTTDAGQKLQVAGTIKLNDTISVVNGDSGQAILTNNSTAVSVSTTTALGGSFAMGGNGAFVIVYGASGSDVFIDTIIAANTGTPTVLSSTIVSGVPSLRTYSTGSNRLQLAMASGTYDVRINILRQT